MNIFELPVHPAAEILPMLGKDELQELAESIKLNGLIEPIVLGANPDGEVWLVDGRNRREACRIAGVEPVTRTLNGEDQLDFIAAVSNNRRHMTKGQQAMAWAVWYPEPEKGGRGKKNAVKITEFNSATLSHARTVLRFAPEKTALVLSGAEPLSEAYAVARNRKSAAEGEVSRLERLKESHPDLANQVIEGEITLAMGEAGGKERDDVRKAQVKSRRECMRTVADSMSLLIAQTKSYQEDCPDIDWGQLADDFTSAAKNITRESK